MAILIIICIVVMFSLINITPKDLKIHFIDVGQGDSTFIITPQNKTILIDGGGSEFSDYDVGKNTLLPYILDRGYTKIDYVIISHFDNDHVAGILTILEELKVERVYISKQGKINENYKKFVKIVNEKNIKVKYVNAGDRVNIEKNLYLDIIWPCNTLITENVLNNNSIVCKLNYGEISMLFTGDIEKIAENEILQYWKNNENILKADILKVAHHGSKTSSTLEFIEKVRPQICLIGVGKNNKFGHPNENVLQSLESLKARIYRTDESGEISINIRGKNLKIEKHIK